MSNRIFQCILCILPILACFLSCHAHANQNGTVYALLIGINKYKVYKSKNKSWAHLKYTGRDVKGLHRVLTGQGKVPKQNIKVLLNQSATKANIINTLRTWFKKAKANDTVMLYFSGHGAAGSDGISYWMAYDTPKNAVELGIGNLIVGSILKGLNTQRVILLIDACQSAQGIVGTRGGTGRKGTTNPSLYSSSGRVTIASSLQNQFSYESKKLRHGIFSYALMQALQGKADDNKDGTVDVLEVYRYLYYHVPKLAKKLENGRQQPAISMRAKGIFALSFPGKPIPTTPLSPQQLKQTGIRLQIRPALASVWINHRLLGTANSLSSNIISLDTGTHAIQIKKEGYKTKNITISLRKGEIRTIHIQLSRQANNQPQANKGRFGYIDVQASDKTNGQPIIGANIILDGQDTRKKTPATLTNVPTGRHRITLRHKAYRLRGGSIVVNVQADQASKPVFSMIPTFGTLQIQRIPKGTIVYLNGTSQSCETLSSTPTSCQIKDHKQGTFALKLQHPDYQTQETQITIPGERKRVTFSASMRSSVGYLLVRTVPLGARVSILGKTWTTPLNQPIKLPTTGTGQHQLIITKDKYSTVHRTIQLSPDSTKHNPKHFFIRLKSNHGTLILTNVPTGTKVSVDGRAHPHTGQGQTRRLSLPLGRHTLQLTNPQYAPYQRELYLNPQQPMTLHTKMKRLTGHLTILTTPPNAKVYLNGQLRGTSTLTLHKVPTGKHRLTLKAHGTHTKTLFIHVREGKNKVSIPMNKQPTLTVRCKPSGSRVFVDDKEIGPSPQYIPVNPGNHLVACKKASHRTRQQTVWVGKRSNKVVTFTLSRDSILVAKCPRRGTMTIRQIKPVTRQILASTNHGTRLTVKPGTYEIQCTEQTTVTLANVFTYKTRINVEPGQLITTKTDLQYARRKALEQDHKNTTKKADEILKKQTSKRVAQGTLGLTGSYRRRSGWFGTETSIILIPKATFMLSAAGEMGFRGNILNGRVLNGNSYFSAEVLGIGFIQNGLVFVELAAAGVGFRLSPTHSTSLDFGIEGMAGLHFRGNAEFIGRLSGRIAFNYYFGTKIGLALKLFAGVSWYPGLPSQSPFFFHGGLQLPLWLAQKKAK